MSKEYGFEAWKKLNTVSDERTFEAMVLDALSRIEKKPSGNTPDLLHDVVLFHEKFMIAPNKRLQEQKIEHLTEELNEVIQAEGDEEILDGLIDLIYVALGKVYAHGWETVFYEGWKRVHEANMKKLPAMSKSKKVKKPKNWEPPQFGDLV